MTVEPLRGAQGSRWPFEHQPVHKPDTAMFPGLDISKLAEQQRTWGKCITRQGANNGQPAKT
eukprot:6000711-Amphidinium_carterae.1